MSDPSSFAETPLALLRKWLCAEWDVAPKNGARFALGQRPAKWRIENAYMTGSRDVIHRLSALLTDLEAAPPQPTPTTGVSFDPRNNTVPFDQAGYEGEAVASRPARELDEPIDVDDALDRVRSLVKSEAGHIAYLDDELNALVRTVRREAR